MVRIGRHVRRVGDAQVAVDLSAHGEPRGRARAAAARDQRIDLESVQAEELVRGALNGLVYKRLCEQARGRADARLRERRLARVVRRQLAARDERHHVGLRQRGLGADVGR